MLICGIDNYIVLSLYPPKTSIYMIHSMYALYIYVEYQKMTQVCFKYMVNIIHKYL